MSIPDQVLSRIQLQDSRNRAAAADRIRCADEAAGGFVSGPDAQAPGPA